MLRFLNYLFIRFLPCLVWCAVILKSGSIFSQQSIDLSLDWQSSMSVVVNGSTLSQPQILGQKNEIGCLTYTFSQQVKYSNADVSFNIVDEEIAP